MGSMHQESDEADFDQSAEIGTWFHTRASPVFQRLGLKPLSVRGKFPGLWMDSYFLSCECPAIAPVLVDDIVVMMARIVACALYLTTAGWFVWTSFCFTRLRYLSLFRSMPRAAGTQEGPAEGARV